MQTKESITETLIEFQSGQITLKEAVDRLAGETIHSKSATAESNRRLRSLCDALQREPDSERLTELKRALRDEFYHGDQSS